VQRTNADGTVDLDVRDEADRNRIRLVPPGHRLSSVSKPKAVRYPEPKDDKELDRRTIHRTSSDREREEFQRIIAMLAELKEQKIEHEAKIEKYRNIVIKSLWLSAIASLKGN